MGIISKIKYICFVYLRIKKYEILSDCKNVIGNPIKCHPLLLKGKGKISFGKNVQIGVLSSPFFYSHYSYFEARETFSEISIGDDVAINNAFSIECNAKVIIENDVLIGSFCSIMDNDGHDLAIEKRKDGNHPKMASIHIQQNVFLGSNVTILKGVTIGKNSIIGNGSVVTKSIPDNVIAAGNPAKVIRNL
jgi:acetyltransferase-like isoleucine patch superfamily enzyme